MVQFNKAVKYQEKLRLALIGPAGSGKTYTALSIAQHLGQRIALMDTEHGSSAKYADLFNFDSFTPDNFAVEVYIEAIKAADAASYDVLILDSASHAWAGKGGLLEFVDTETARSHSHNAYSEGWRKATPKHNEFIDTMLACGLHLIVTMRTKTEYVVEKNDKGQSVPRKVGLQPIQRDGLEYEFDVVADMDLDNNMVIAKTRCPALTGKVFNKAGKQVADILGGWLTGAPKAEKPKADNIMTLEEQAEMTGNVPTPAALPSIPAPKNGNGDGNAPKADPLAAVPKKDKPMSQSDFYRMVLKEIPYYKHVNHINNSLKLCGYPNGYKAGEEVEMLQALQQHATAKANEEAAAA